MEALEDRLQNLPLLKALRNREDKLEWYESRPYTGIPDEIRVNNLTAGALSGPGKLAVRPLIRVKNDESETWGFIHLGRGLCGHDGIVHGGLMATLLDESMGRVVSTGDASGPSAHHHPTGILQFTKSHRFNRQSQFKLPGTYQSGSSAFQFAPCLRFLVQGIDLPCHRPSLLSSNVNWSHRRVGRRSSRPGLRICKEIF